MKIGFIFAGQGAQFVTMGKDLYEHYPIVKEMYDNHKIDFDVKKLCFEGPNEQLIDTAYAQAAIFLTSMAIAEVVKIEGILPEYVAGLSLGEYSALGFAGAFDLQSGLEIVRKRGQIMASALPKNISTMSAVLGLEADIIREVCELVSKEFGVCEIANYNCPGQIVITGETLAMDVAGAQLLERGARRVIPLSVSGAFHSSLLEDASKELSAVLAQYELDTPKIPVIYNVSGKEETADLNDILTKQIKSSVYFQQSIEYMIHKGVDTFIEIGPGSTLKGFVRKIDRDKKVYSVDSVETLQKMLEEIKSHG